MPFHRFNDPLYNLLGGSFPGTIGEHTYDYINVTDGGTGGIDGSANADGAKAGAPNNGTYFVAFGEHGLSLHANRANKALGENCDVLDNLLHENLPLTLAQVGATAGGTIGSFAVTGAVDVFVGGPGSSQLNPEHYARLVDQNGDAIYNGGSRVTISGIEDGSSNNVMGNAQATAPDGFHTDPTFIFSQNILIGVQFRIIIATRSSYALLTQEALKYVPHADRLNDANLQALLGHVRYAGLDEKYRRASSVPGGTSGDAMTALLDTPGDGATVQRDGKAITVVDPNLSILPKSYVDTWMALLTTELSGSLVAGDAWTEPATGGSSGLVLELLPPNDLDSAHQLKNTTQHAGLVAACPRDIILDTNGGAGTSERIPLTKVNPALSARLNPDALGGTNDRRTIELHTSDYFVLLPDEKTGVKVGVDYLKITFPTGEVETYLIVGLLGFTADPAVRRAYIQSLDGNNPDFGTTAGGTIVNAQLIQRVMSVSTNAGSADTGGSEFFNLHGLNADGGVELVDWSASRANRPTAFWAATTDPTEAGTRPDNRAIRNRSFGAAVWGGFDKSTGQRDRSHLGYLLGDGSIETAGRMEGMPNGRHDSELALSTASPSVEWHPMGGFSSSPVESDLIGSVVHLRSTTGSAQTITLNWHLGYTPKLGDRLTLIVENEVAGTVALAGTAVADMLFSEGDDTIQADAGLVVKYEMVLTTLGSPVSGNRFLVTRTSYDLSP